MPHKTEELTDHAHLSTPPLTLFSSRSVSMAPRKPRKTRPLANRKQTITTPSVDPQNDCPLFKLPPELRDMIYIYVFAPGLELSSDSTVVVAALGDRYYKRSPSGVVLRTCRLHQR